MCKTSPIIIGFIVFSVMAALLMSGCIGPLDINRFLEGEKVQNIINEDNDGEEEISDPWQPLLKQNGTPIAMGEAVTIFFSGTPNSVTISVDNYENFKDDSFLWTSNRIEVGSGNTVTISSDQAPFNSVADHLLTVVVEDQNGAFRSSFITIRVVL